MREEGSGEHGAGWGGFADAWDDAGDAVGLHCWWLGGGWVVWCEVEYDYRVVLVI